MNEYTVDQTLENLRHQVAFQELIEELETYWRELTQELMTCELDMIERQIGRMQAHRELLDMFRGDSA